MLTQGLLPGMGVEWVFPLNSIVKQTPEGDCLGFNPGVIIYSLSGLCTSLHLSFLSVKWEW